jgi:NMD protein affecting ribosome stability and mRNA decay
MKTCPQCGGRLLEPVSDGESINFFCRSCLACWHVELGYVRRVEVSSCPGCEHFGACLLRRTIESSEGAGLQGMLQ